MAAAAMAVPKLPFNISDKAAARTNLHDLAGELLSTWSDALLTLQVTDTSNVQAYGGILSPDNGKVPGRCADAIYPLCCRAQQTDNHRYVDAAELLYNWMEDHVSDADGAWLNEPQPGSWKGITVFTSIALCETLRHHNAVLQPKFSDRIKARLLRSAQYIHDHFTIDYGNINYPISASYALLLAGELLDHAGFRRKAAELASQSKAFFSEKDTLIFGEGQPYYELSPKGCVPVDLGYNVEESLPSLLQYALMAKDDTLLEMLEQSMHAHLQFMLPDGGWDNSWGTRNYKWTYWGSRTSDGCQTAYALMANRDPQFYTAALRNAELLRACTVNGLLQGGPHLHSHGLKPNAHHTFCHMKAMANVLNDARPYAPAHTGKLPREAAAGVRFFADVQTWLLATGDWRATVTGYDRNYKDFINGHPTGGAMSMLWHPGTGPLLAASMNEYQLYEKDNMQVDSDPHSIPLTPRMECMIGNTRYANIMDNAAKIIVDDQQGRIQVTVSASLVDGRQQSPPGGAVTCEIEYRLSKDGVQMTFTADAAAQQEGLRIVLPVICRSDEPYKISGNKASFQRGGLTIQLIASRPWEVLPTGDRGRVFNYVPGFEAVPLLLPGRSGSIRIEIV